MNGLIKFAVVALIIWYVVLPLLGSLFALGYVATKSQQQPPAPDFSNAVNLSDQLPVAGFVDGFDY